MLLKVAHCIYCAILAALAVADVAEGRVDGSLGFIIVDGQFDLDQ